VVAEGADEQAESRESLLAVDDQELGSGRTYLAQGEH